MNECKHKWEKVNQNVVVRRCEHCGDTVTAAEMSEAARLVAQDVWKAVLQLKAVAGVDAKSTDLFKAGMSRGVSFAVKEVERCFGASPEGSDSV